MSFDLFASNEVGQGKLGVGEEFAHRVVLLQIDKAHNLTVVLRDRVADAIVVVESGLLPQPIHLVLHSLPAEPIYRVIEFLRKVLVQSLVCSIELLDAAQAHFVDSVLIGGISSI